jgi:putative endonuclease
MRHLEAPRGHAVKRRARRRDPDWSVYIVRCRDGALYTGIALDVRRRLAQHAAADGRGAKYLRGRGPLRLALMRVIGSRSLALSVESRIKRLRRSEKLRLLARRPVLDGLIALARRARRPA